MHHALDHIRDNMAMLKPGVTHPRAGLRRPPARRPQYWKQKYSCKMHGVGLCDEWPYRPLSRRAGWTAPSRPRWNPAWSLCVEALVSPEGGDFSIKLEDQVLITETGYENLTRYPFDPRLTGAA